MATPHKSSKGLHFDLSSLYHSSTNDLDMDAIEKIFSLRKGKKKSFKDTILASFNIINEEHKSKYPTVTGALTFGKRPEKLNASLHLQK